MSGDLWTAWKPKTPESNKSEAILSTLSRDTTLDYERELLSDTLSDFDTLSDVFMPVTA